MNIASVASLGYLEFGVSDIVAWQRYAEGVLGTTAMPEGDGLLVRLDEAGWRLSIVPSGDDDLRAVGFSVNNLEDLRALQSQLEAAGVAVRQGDAAARRARQVDELLLCEDPFGLLIELYVGERLASTPFVSAQGVSGFVTGDQGLGHIVLFVADEAKAVHFYQQLLGFKLSDHIEMGPPGRKLRLTFLHCNARHHTLALAPVPVPKKLNHLMLQLQTLDDVGLGFDRALAQQVPISSSLGCHTNDKMVSFYMQTPSGFDIEYGFGGVEIDDATWETTTYDAPSIWGHKGNLN
jgi:2,3-dihydroxybiphenyl 1,2-dioxygenase